MISKEEIRNLAELARLEVSDAEAESLGKDISNILDYVGQLQSVKTEAGEAGYSPLKNILREDTPRQEGDALANKKEALLKALPAREGDFAVVRKIIEK